MLSSPLLRPPLSPTPAALPAAWYADEMLQQRLRHLECKLTLAQVVTYRTCVAMRHSR